MSDVHTRARDDPLSPVRIVVAQHGRVVLDGATRPDAQESTAEKLMGDRRSRRRNDGARPTSTAVNMCIDRETPFAVYIYIHRSSDRFRRGFWHTENLDGHVRIGNAQDRSPSTSPTAPSFPFPSPGPTGGEVSDYDHCHRKYCEKGWKLCGSLPQKAGRRTGYYRLRLSPSFNTSRDDEIFETTYEVSPSAHARSKRPWPPEASTFELGHIPQKRGHKRTLTSVDNTEEERRGPPSRHGVTPVVLRVSQLSLDLTRRQLPAHDSRSASSSPRSLPVDDDDLDQLQGQSDLQDLMQLTEHEYLRVAARDRGLAHGTPYGGIGAPALDARGPTSAPGHAFHAVPCRPLVDVVNVV